jgi:hypothetical protein
MDATVSQDGNIHNTALKSMHSSHMAANNQYHQCFPKMMLLCTEEDKMPFVLAQLDPGQAGRMRAMLSEAPKRSSEHIQTGFFGLGLQNT